MHQTEDTCLHPNCAAIVKRSRLVCNRHYAALTDELRDMVREARPSSPTWFEAVTNALLDYFQDRMIGELEISRCRGKDCGADIVWLVTRAGKNVAVNRDGVERGDDQFRYGKHVAHVTTCPNADELRRSR